MTREYPSPLPEGYEVRESRHTPGPWTMEARRLSSGEVIDIGIRTPYLFIAAVEPHYESVADAVANARLIAAAPELLAALRAAVEWDRKRPAVTQCGVTEFYMEVPEWVYAARAAIARAEGRS